LHFSLDYDTKLMKKIRILAHEERLLETILKAERRVASWAAARNRSSWRQGLFEK